MNMKKLLLASSLSLLGLAASATPADPLVAGGFTPGAPLTINFVGESATDFLIPVNSGAQNTWGEGVVSYITDSYNHFWSPSNGDFLFYTITGISDTKITTVGPSTYVDSVGSDIAHGGDGFIHLNLYLMSAAPSGYGCIISSTCVAAVDPFSGTPYLAITFKAGIDSTDPSAQLYQSLSANDNDGSGLGSFYAGVSGGTNSAEWLLHGGNFLTGNFTVNPLNKKICQAVENPSIDGSTFCSKIADPIETPEPASLAMVGLGLAALARLRRRKE